MTDETISYTEYMYKTLLEYVKELIELKKKNLSDINAIMAYMRTRTFEPPKTEVKEVDD